jgi:uncharacterized membrane protein HdeD (DUF308 family)
MSNFQLIFISLLVIVQCSLGILLLYHGISLLVESFEVKNWKFRLLRLGVQLKSAMTSPLGKKLTLLALFFIPGSIPIMLAITFWRSLRQNQ